MSAVEPLVFQKAQILCYRIFDIAEEIDLEKARSALSAGTQRLRLAREGSEYLQLPNPPLSYELHKETLVLLAGNVEVDATARLFDHGAASIILSVKVAPGTDTEGLIRLADELYDSRAVEQMALRRVNELREKIPGALEAPHLWEQNESYTIVFVEHIEGSPRAAEVAERGELARLLLGEPKLRTLSERERSEVTQHRFSYTEDDLVVVDWNSAFVYEPSGSRDIPDVLEICNAQLLEFRYYDSLLDERLTHIYSAVEHKRSGLGAIFKSPYKQLAREVLVMVLEMSEFIERVENSLKIIGDFYLAKVYEAAVKRLRIPSWQASVTRKQQLLTGVYQLLKGEVDTERSLTLETTIALLIVTELFLAVVSVLRH